MNTVFAVVVATFVAMSAPVFAQDAAVTIPDASLELTGTCLYRDNQGRKYYEKCPTGEFTVVEDGEPVVWRACEFSPTSISDLGCLTTAALGLKEFRMKVMASAASDDLLLVEHLKLKHRMAMMSERMKMYDKDVSDTAIQLLMRTDDVKTVIDQRYKELTAAQ